jgi:hypothetical protein
VARISDKLKEPHFHQSYGWQLCDALEQKKEIQELVQKRVKK